MAATSFNDAVSKDIGRCRFILLSAALGIVVLMLPLQHYQTLGRYQHYALGVAVCRPWISRAIDMVVPQTYTAGKILPLDHGAFSRGCGIRALDQSMARLARRGTNRIAGSAKGPFAFRIYGVCLIHLDMLALPLDRRDAH